MRRVAIGFLLLAAVAAGLLFSCESVRHGLVGAFSPEYEPPVATELEPVFDKADAKRPKIDVVLRKAASGFIQPTDIAFVPGEEDLMLVLEKAGRLRWVELGETPARGTLLELPVLDASEQGLLGIAFHPKFRDNGRFYLNYTVEHEGAEVTRVAEWVVPAGADLREVKPTMQRIILDVRQPYQNHNAGQLLFGPDGFMYIGFGDGGWRADPHEHGQNGETMLGSMLRIDVDRREAGKAYAVPNDNPFVGREGYLPEVWAIGLRNPWRYSFTPDGRLIAGDVGQDEWEEVTFVPRGANLGWNIREGSHCFEEQSCRSEGLLDPIHDYGRDEGGSVTGGFVFLDESFPELHRKYVFGDFLSGRMWAFDLPAKDSDRVDQINALGRWPILISTFGRDSKGRVYLADYPRGDIYRIDRPPSKEQN